MLSINPQAIPILCLLFGTFEAVHGLHSMKCKGVDMKLTEHQATHIKECTHEVGATVDETMTIDKMPCFAKCIFEHKKLVDEKGLPHKENIMSMFSDTLPNDVKEELKTVMGKCLDDHVDEVEVGDEACITYTPLALCVHDAYDQVCTTSK